MLGFDILLVLIFVINGYESESAIPHEATLTYSSGIRCDKLLAQRTEEQITTDGDATTAADTREEGNSSCKI